MKNKITTFKKLSEILEPNTITLIGSSFNPFNLYYFKLLQWASQKTRPLVAMVQTDKIVSLRRGFILPNENHYKRAQRIARLDFVDYVVISNRLAHDPWCLKLLCPKVVIFQRDNPVYLRRLFNILSLNFPKIHFKVAPFKRNFNLQTVTSFLNFRKNKPNKQNLDKIEKRLISVAQNSKSPIGKISAILTYKNKIITEAYNSPKGEHAEILLLKKIRLKRYLDDYTLYVLVPPCIMCAEAIFRSKIKNIYYLYHYGDELGIEYFKKKGVVVKRYKKYGKKNK